MGCCGKKSKGTGKIKKISIGGTNIPLSNDPIAQRMYGSVKIELPYEININNNKKGKK